MDLMCILAHQEQGLGCQQRDRRITVYYTRLLPGLMRVQISPVPQNSLDSNN